MIIIFFYIRSRAKRDRELARLAHDLDDLSSSLHIEAHLINELS